MKLVISAATRISDLRVLMRILDQRAPAHVRAMLITPLMVTPLTLRVSRQVEQEYGIPIMFDSGGYAVQTGRLDYFEMYSRLLELYRRERWASLYTLPDNVPLSGDSIETVEQKVRQTVACSEMFYRELPDEVRGRALAVAHGRTLAQVEFCLDRYARLGIQHVGFGSFGTAGKNSSMNVATTSAVANARRLAELAHARGLTTHLFGVGTPAILPWIAGTGATSFDSANWARSAGFGQVFLPLTRGYNVSHRFAVSTIQQGLTRERFEQLRRVSGHACPYCASFERLQLSREARAGHNLFATVDALDIIARDDRPRMEAIYAAASPRYRTRWRRWLEDA
ncbi:MAG: hypothetical protein ACYDCQ_01215 [Dehalococcoidia bacterium]